MPVKKKKSRNTFRVSSALKDIIGRELITDDFIAVFELVKNSFDAGAKRVDVIFNDIYGKDPNIVIKDNGKGMDGTDIEDKWLFVAYSAKKEGTEDDYRNKISANKYYAGAKGIGRFSCDKLGSELTIFSKKATKNTVYKLDVDWTKFEDDVHKDFSKITVSHGAAKSNPYDINKGTVLEIRNLREAWNRDKLLKLKRSLEKLINPNQGKDKKTFKIFLSVSEEKQNDKDILNESEEYIPWDIINGEINNFLFEDLGLKTTQINTKISQDGKTITTRLVDRGVLVYEIVEENSFTTKSGMLKDIDVHLFALNQVAKTHFTKRMGTRAVNYGSVFLYKNGFRIYPFGEVGDDSFQLDKRKGQHSSNLGTRDVIGRIEINGENSDFQEKSSRDGGFVGYDSYQALIDYFTEYAVKRLEKFIFDIKKFGLFESEILKANLSKDVKVKIFEIIKGLSKPNRGRVIDIKYDENFLSVLKNASEKSLKTFLRNFEKVARETGDQKLQKDIGRAQKQLHALAKEKEKAEKYAEIAVVARQDAELVAKEALNSYASEKKKNLFFKSVVKDSDTVNVGLVHHIKLTSESMDARVASLYNDIVNDNFSKERALKYLADIKLLSDKILKLSEIASLADVNFKYEKQKGDLIRYLQEYIYEIKGIQKGFNISVVTNKMSHTMRFSVLEFTIIIDNLISNAVKADADSIVFEAKKNKGIFELHVYDDGAGVDKSIEDEIFEPGITSRRGGSGIGLYSVRDSLKNGMNATIDFVGNGNALSGAEFVIRFK